jgi:hypothetical protein
MILYFCTASVLARSMIPVLSHTERSAHFMVKNMQNGRKRYPVFLHHFFYDLKNGYNQDMGHVSNRNFPFFWRIKRFIPYLMLYSETCLNAADYSENLTLIFI